MYRASSGLNNIFGLLLIYGFEQKKKNNLEIYTAFKIFILFFNSVIVFTFWNV